MQENKENVSKFSNARKSPRKQIIHNIRGTPEKGHHTTFNDSSITEETTFWHCQSETTFETIERMCNKTLSDPENSIHEYLSDWEKKHSQHSKSDDEVLALNRLFEDFGIHNQDNSKLADQTQLSEVEPPSCLWDNTVNNESALPISPVKIVGLLRPSTILEESATDSTVSSNSFKSAQQPVDTASSDQYETANETQSCSTKPCESRELSTDSGHSTSSKPDASAYFEMFPLREIPFNNKPKEPRVYNKAIFFKGKRSHGEAEDSLSSSNDTSRGISSLSLDSLEKSRRRSRSGKFLEDSLEITSDFQGQQSTREDVEKKGNLRYETKKEHGFRDSNNLWPTNKNDDNSVIVISDEESMHESNTTNSEDLNKGFLRGGSEESTYESSIISSENSELNVSREFNDTLEEIEYIMTQGKKYLANKSVSPPKTVQTTPKVQKTPTMAASPATPCTIIKRPKPKSSTKKAISPLHAKAMLRARNTVRLDHRFDHIVSPIRTYIRNTPKSPMTVNMKKTQNIFDSKFGKDSRPPSSRIASSEKEIPSKVLCSLPRKAYVSAEYRHIVDQRSPISIPGGEKIHQYLESAILPTVLRHEGKFKTNLKSRQKSDLDKSKGSLADFSIASGDMSVLLLKDAKNLASKY